MAAEAEPQQIENLALASNSGKPILENSVVEPIANCHIEENSGDSAQFSNHASMSLETNNLDNSSASKVKVTDSITGCTMDVDHPSILANIMSDVNGDKDTVSVDQIQVTEKPEPMDTSDPLPAAWKIPQLESKTEPMDFESGNEILLVVKQDGLLPVLDNSHPLSPASMANLTQGIMDRQIMQNRPNFIEMKDMSLDKTLKPAINSTKVPKPKSTRRVKFCPDGHDETTYSVVKSYHDAPNPWSCPAGFTPQRLVDTYRQACTTNGVRPISKLITQLEATTDVGERYETLTLKGERLDRRHCDAIEEVLKRVQFKTMDLEATDLDDESAGAVFDMLEFYDSATRLVLAYNKSIGPRGWQACSRMMKRAPSLTHLDLRSCTITEHSMPFLGRALRVGSQLTVLHLENSSISGKVLLILIAALKLNDYLKELYLADNRLMPSDGIQIGNLLKHNNRIQLLDLRNNHLQDVGHNHISDGLVQQDEPGVGLSTLVLWNNQLTFHSMAPLARVLSINKALETLNLGHNNLTNEGIFQLKEGLLKNKVLKRLGIQAARISCEGAIALAEVIADSQCMVRLDLRENEIRTAGLMALSLSLKMNQSVCRLDLDKEVKKERGVKDAAEQQASLLSDIANWLQRNRENAYCLEQENLKREKEAEERKKLEEAQSDEIAADEIACEKGEGEITKRPLALLNFAENRSESLESPMVAAPPDDFSSRDLDEMAPPVSSEKIEEYEHMHARTTGGRMFSVKYIPEDTFLSMDKMAADGSRKGGKIAGTESIADTIMSPTCEFPISMNPAEGPFFPVLVMHTDPLHPAIPAPEEPPQDIVTPPSIPANSGGPEQDPVTHPSIPANAEGVQQDSVTNSLPEVPQPAQYVESSHANGAKTDVDSSDNSDIITPMESTKDPVSSATPGDVSHADVVSDQFSQKNHENDSKNDENSCLDNVQMNAVDSSEEVTS